MGVRSEGLPYANQDWYKRSDGHRYEARTALTETQIECIDWLLDPGQKPTQVEWAEAHGVSPRTIRGWKKSKLFTDEWERRAALVNGGIERIQLIVDKLYESALQGDVKAIQLYLQYVDRFTPKKQVEVGRAVEDLSDEELAQALESVAVLRKGA